MASVQYQFQKRAAAVRVANTLTRCGMVLVDLPEILGVQEKNYGDYGDHDDYTGAQWSLLGAEADRAGAVRGDIVRCETVEDSYRNGGVMGVWDGTKIVPLVSDPDDYGTLPEEFGVLGEFAVGFWQDQIAHNSYVWLHDPRRFMPQLLEQFGKPEPTGSEAINEHHGFGACVVLEHHGARYKFVYDNGRNGPERLRGYGVTIAELVDVELKSSADYKYCMMLKEFAGTGPVLCSYAADRDTHYAGTLVLGSYFNG
jgi:hypothetical protein